MTTNQLLSSFTDEQKAGIVDSINDLHLEMCPVAELANLCSFQPPLIEKAISLYALKQAGTALDLWLNGPVDVDGKETDKALLAVNAAVKILCSKEIMNGKILLPYLNSVVCGNCQLVLPCLPDNSIHLVATDGPYFIDGMDDEWSHTELKKKEKKAKKSAIKGLPVGMKFDPEQGIKLQAFYEGVFKECFRVEMPGGFLLAFSQGRLYHRLAMAAEVAGYEIRDLLIWEHKGGQGKAQGMQNFIKKMKIPESEKVSLLAKIEGRKTPQLRPKFEAIVLAQKPKEGTFVINWNKWSTGLIDPTGKSTVFFCKKPNSRKQFKHLTIKPVDLMKDLIETFTIPGQIVLDPFLGSGTTAVACALSHRQYIGIELDPNFCKIAKERIIKESVLHIK